MYRKSRGISFVLYIFGKIKLELYKGLFLRDDLNHIFVAHDVVDPDSLWTKLRALTLEKKEKDKEVKRKRKEKR